MTHWANQAKQWALLGSPLKPSPIDIENSTTWINETILFQDSFSVLVLGVTPELINISWPSQTQLLAIDYNLLMLKLILPKESASIKPMGLQGNWLQLPISESSLDLVIGDGCYNSLAAKDYALLSGEVQRVLKPTGHFIMRFFSKPDVAESIELLQEDLCAGRISNFHAFKLRLAIALHQDFAKGICLKIIWEIWNTYFKKMVQTTQQQLQWSDELIGSIDTYKESNFFYTFPTLNEIRHSLNTNFLENDLFIPTYQLGGSCPTLRLSPCK